MNLYEKQKRNKGLLTIIFFLLFCGFFAFVAIFYFFETKSFQRLEHMHNSKIRESYMKSLRTHLQKNCTQQLEVFIDDDVKNALKNKQRDTLYALTHKLFEKAKQKDPYLKVLHFHLRDGSSFLRVHNPDSFGDKIAQERAYIAWVHKTQKRVYGFEKGRIDTPFYRVIEPLFVDGEYIGAVEIGASPQKVLDLVSEYNAIEGALIFFYTEKPIVFDNISNKKLLQNYMHNFTMQRSEHSTVKEANRIYKFYTFDIKSFDDKTIGEFIFFYDFTHYYKEFDKTIAFMICLAILLLIIMFIMMRLLVLKHQKSLQSVNERTQAILDLQSDIVIVTNGDEIIEINEKFLEYFAYKTLKEFKQEYRCVCELFIAGEGLVSPMMGNDVWTEYLLKNQDKDNIAKIDLAGKSYLFALHAQKLYSKQEQKVEIVVTMQDITLLKMKERELANYLKLVDHNIMISSTDLQGNITYVSQAFMEVSGYDKEDLLGANHRIIRHEDMPCDVFEDLWNTISQDKVWHGEIKNKKHEGGSFWSNTWIHPKFNQHGVKVGYTGVRHDISDKKILEEMAITDGLTALYNRRYFDIKAPQIINIAKRENRCFCFMIIDVDHFKLYNDTYGHQKGDEALQSVAKEMMHSFKRAGDYCFRLGGEEFGVIFGVKSKEEAYEMAEGLRVSVEDLHIEHKKSSVSQYLSISIGLVCKAAVDVTNIAQVYKQADTLLYETKTSGRNKVSI